MTGFKERREFRRVPTRLDARVRFAFTEPGTVEQRGVTQDVSATGALLMLRKPIDVGTLVYLSVGAPGEVARFRALAEVVRPGPDVGQRRHLVGFAFVDLIGETTQGLDARLTQAG